MAPRFHESPSWRMVIVTWFVIFCIIAVGLVVLVGFGSQLSTLKENQGLGETRGYKNRAVACMDIINDQEIELTGECLDPKVVVWYPPSLCAKIPVPVDGCGREATVVISPKDP